MSRESKIERQRVKAARETTGNSKALDTKKETKSVNPKSLIPGKIKSALFVAGLYGSHLNHETEHIRKLEENYKRWEQKYQTLKMPSHSKDGSSGGDVFADTFHKIMMELKMQDLEKRKHRNEKAQQRHQKFWKNGIGAIQSVGRLADTTTRKTAYSQMTGRTSDVNVPTLQALDTGYSEPSI